METRTGTSVLGPYLHSDRPPEASRLLLPMLHSDIGLIRHSLLTHTNISAGSLCLQGVCPTNWMLNFSVLKSKSIKKMIMHVIRFLGLV